MKKASIEIHGDIDWSKHKMFIKNVVASFRNISRETKVVLDENRNTANIVGSASKVHTPLHDFAAKDLRKKVSGDQIYFIT